MITSITEKSGYVTGKKYLVQEPDLSVWESALESGYATEKEYLPLPGMFSRKVLSWQEIAQLPVARKQHEAEPETEVQKEIQESKYILDLADNWDDEGSKGYQLSTWQRATSFLSNLSAKAWDSFRVTIDAPKIYHGPDGSIDVFWKTDKYQILANIPEDPSLPATFYGSNFKKDSIKGTFDIANGGCNLLMFLVGVKRCTP